MSSDDLGGVAEGQGGKAIDDDRSYYRTDGETIDDIVLKGGFSCRVFLGLRRFGKSSFLRRIERWCNGVNNGWDETRIRHGYRERGAKAYFIEGMNAESMGSSIMTGLDDASEGVTTKIFLIDDIQGYSTLYKRGQTPEVDDALRAVFRAARDNPSEVRIVMAEPTNHLEWLETDPAGKWLVKRCGEALKYVHASILALSKDQSAALLTGSPPDKMGKSDRKYDIPDQQIDKLHAAFGGNPWLLGYAYRMIDSRKDLAILSNKEIGNFIDEVNKGVDPGSLQSIYDSLATHEKLIVNLLADLWITKKDPERREAAEHANRESLTLFESSEKDIWFESAIKYHVRLGEVGLVDLDKSTNIARQLTSDAFASFVHKTVRKNKPILDEPEKIENWSDLISGPSPADRLRSKCVIHQFSDLLFDGSRQGHEYWQKYVDWIAGLKAGKDEKASKDETPPHFIVICGNILPGAVEEDLPGYRKNLQMALQSLQNAVSHLKPVENARTPSPSQIIIVPGVLDIDWPAVNEVPPSKRADQLGLFYERQKIWDQEVAQCEFSVAASEDYASDPKASPHRIPKTIRFSTQRVEFIPFDSVDIAGVKEELGTEAAYDIIDIRRRIRIKFNSDWLQLREDTPAAATKKKNAQRDKSERWGKFLGSTWRYAFDENDPEASRGATNEPIGTPTFRWVEFRADGEGKRKTIEWTSEAGFVSKAARTELPAKIARAADDKVLKIAIMHHAPRQLRRSTLVAFYQSYRLRQALAQAGVNWVLHGNSILQQRVDEIAHSIRGPENAGNRSRDLNLVSSGVFSNLVDRLPADFASDTEGEVLGRPSFNQITVTPPDRDGFGKKDFSVAVNFWEWPSKDAAAPVKTR